MSYDPLITVDGKRLADFGPGSPKRLRRGASPDDRCCCCCEAVYRAVKCDDESGNGWKGARLVVSGVENRAPYPDCSGNETNCSEVDGTYQLCGVFNRNALYLLFTVFDVCTWAAVGNFTSRNTWCKNYPEGRQPMQFAMVIGCQGIAFGGGPYIAVHCYGQYAAAWAITGEEAVRDAIETLGAGGSVVLPFADIIDGFCDSEGSTVTVTLTCPHGDCEAALPDGTCDGLSECVSLPDLSLGLSEFEDVDDSSGSHGPTYDVIHWKYSNLNGGFQLPYTGGGTYEFELQLVDDPNSYADCAGDGILLFESEYSDPTFNRKGYVYKILARITCTDGDTEFDYINFYYSVFEDRGGLFDPVGTSFWQGANVAESAPAEMVANCSMYFTSARFNFEDFFIMFEGDESLHFRAIGAIGPVP